MSFFKFIYNKEKEEYSKTTTVLGFKFKHIYTEKLEELYKNEQYQHTVFYRMLSAVLSASDMKPAGGKLREGQDLSIKLLKELKQICEENDIKYWIDFGTMLGAVRHKGYIPWDSDVDTSMLREDYLKVIPLLKEKYKGTNIEVREYGFGTHFQVRIQPGDDPTYGVDIFPVDRYCKGNLTEEEIAEVNNRIEKATEVKRRACKHDSDLATNPERLREYVKQLQKEMIFLGEDEAEENPALFFAIDYPLPYHNLTRNYDMVFPLGKIEFEGEEYPCPNNLEECLRFLYSRNYMSFPPSFKPEEDKIAEYIESLKK